MKVTGVIHMHSTHSYDGKLSLLELKTFLVERGVQFACMTEHTDYLDASAAAAFVAECRALSDDTFVFIPGFEVPYKNAHVLHIGAEQFIGAFADADSLQRWRSITPLVILAHPVRNAFTIDDELRTVIDGVEVWNQQYEGKAVPRLKSVALLESLRVTRPELVATGGLDFHRIDHWGSPLTFVEVTQLSETNILNVLTSHRFEFGHQKRLVAATDKVTFSLAERLKSTASICVISLGKKVNKLLAMVGLRAPRCLVRLLRETV